ncbi:MAG TPA: hypothetical protein VK157_14090 [Phycisphaerales bacterium]|nr:hypothetical protein [Phycisphaerales bacterium]
MSIRGDDDRVKLHASLVRVHHSHAMKCLDDRIVVQHAHNAQPSSGEACQAKIMRVSACTKDDHCLCAGCAAPQCGSLCEKESCDSQVTKPTRQAVQRGWCHSGKGAGCREIMTLCAQPANVLQFLHQGGQASRISMYAVGEVRTERFALFIGKIRDCLEHMDLARFRLFAKSCVESSNGDGSLGVCTDAGLLLVAVLCISRRWKSNDADAGWLSRSGKLINRTHV